MLVLPTTGDVHPIAGKTLQLRMTRNGNVVDRNTSELREQAEQNIQHSIDRTLHDLWQIGSAKVWLWWTLPSEFYQLTAVALTRAGMRLALAFTHLGFDGQGSKRLNLGDVIGGMADFARPNWWASR